MSDDACYVVSQEYYPNLGIQSFYWGSVTKMQLTTPMADLNLQPVQGSRPPPKVTLSADTIWPGPKTPGKQIFLSCRTLQGLRGYLPGAEAKAQTLGQF